MMSLLVTASQLILYLGLGILSDILISAYTVFVSEDLLYPAALTSATVSFFNLFLIVKYFVVTPSVINMLAYAIGTGIGTIILMKLRRYYKQWRGKNAKRTSVQRN